MQQTLARGDLLSAINSPIIDVTVFHKCATRKLLSNCWRVVVDESNIWYTSRDTILLSNPLQHLLGISPERRKPR